MQRNADSREALFDAFAELVVDRPYATISLNDLYAVAGLTKGQFYAMFDSREAAAISLAQSEFDIALTRVSERLRHLDSSFELLVAAMYELTGHLLERSRFHAAILLQAEIGRNSALPPGDVDRWRGFLRTQIGHAVSAGDVVGQDLDAIADFVLASWVGARVLSDLTTSLADMTERVTSILRFIVAAIVVPERQNYLLTFIDRYARRLTAAGEV